MGTTCCNDSSVQAAVEFENRTLEAADGTKVLLRLARLEDQAALEEHVCERSETGAGVAGDQILKGLFPRFVTDPRTLVVFAEEAETRCPLGMNAVTFSYGEESFWHSLRVGEASRGKGLAKILFKECARHCIQRQGSSSISRWGVVSTNSVMVNWSARMRLQGPETFIHFMMPMPPDGNKGVADALPQGWTCRIATPADSSLICSHVSGQQGSWVLAASKYGSKNFLKYGSVATLQPEHIEDAIAGKTLEETDSAGRKGSTHLAPLVFDDKGALVGLAHYCHEVWPFSLEHKFALFWGYIDGTCQGIQVVMDVLRYHVQSRGYEVLHGYFPELDFLIADLDGKGSVASRWKSTTEQVYEWANASMDSQAQPAGAAGRDVRG